MVYEKKQLIPVFCLTLLAGIGLHALYRLCPNALTALSGGMVGQYQRTADINGGTGIVVIGLACLIIGETVLGRRSILKGAIAVIVGSIIYRLIYAIVLYTKVVPVECLKLVTAIIVGLAIAAPTLRSWVAFQKKKAMAGKEE